MKALSCLYFYWLSWVSLFVISWTLHSFILSICHNRGELFAYLLNLSVVLSHKQKFGNFTVISSVISSILLCVDDPSFRDQFIYRCVLLAYVLKVFILLIFTSSLLNKMWGEVLHVKEIIKLMVQWSCVEMRKLLEIKSTGYKLGICMRPTLSNESAH